MPKHTTRQSANTLVEPFSREKHNKQKDSLALISCIPQIQNERFPLPCIDPRNTNKGTLRRAIAEVKPCLDLRHVRRGRKVFSIPRIIPSDKQSAFGVRELLSVLTKSKTSNIEKPAKKGSFTSHRKIKIGEKNNVDITVGSKSISSVSFQEGSDKKSSPTIDTNSVFSQQSRDLISSSSLNNIYTPFSLRNKFPYSQAILCAKRKKQLGASAFSLSSSLSREIKASSGSQSRTIESKKRVYRVASSNRGSIRLSWWL